MLLSLLPRLYSNMLRPCLFLFLPVLLFSPTKRDFWQLPSLSLLSGETLKTHVTHLRDEIGTPCGFCGDGMKGNLHLAFGLSRRNPKPTQLAGLVSRPVLLGIC